MTLASLGKPISAPLNFTPGGNPLLGAMTGVGGLAGQYALSYDSALKTNQQNYNNIVDLYRTTLENVGNTLGQGDSPWGVAAPAAQAIQDQYAMASGSAIQNSINRGLGQTTAATAAQRGASFDASKAYAGLGSSLAQSFAGYQSGLGQGLAGILNSVQAPYPDAGAYNQLFGNLMGFQQAQQAREDQQRAAAYGRFASSGGGGVNVVGAGGGGVPRVNTGGGQTGYVSPIMNSTNNNIGGTTGFTYTGGPSAGSSPGGYVPTTGYPTGGYAPSPYGGLAGVWAGLGNVGNSVLNSFGSVLGNLGGGLSGLFGGGDGGSVEDEY